MNKGDYHKKTLERLRSLANDESFIQDQHQIRAEVNALEYGDPTDIDTHYDSSKVWNTCRYIVNSFSKLTTSKEVDARTLTDTVKRAGETLEFLSELEDGIQSDLALIASALCYEMTGMKANAVCLSRRLDDRISEDHPLREGDLEAEFLNSLIALLSSDVSSIKDSAAKISNLINSSDDEKLKSRVDDISISYLERITGFAYISEFCRSYYEYCLTGKQEHIEDSIRSVRESSLNFSETSYYRLETITKQVEASLHNFYKRSTWHSVESANNELVEDNIWRFYLRNLAFDDSITEFWPSQIEAIKRGILNANDSFLVQMPTSAGKTLVAELSILAALTQHDRSKCLYIAPFRALSSEVRDKLAHRLGKVGFQVDDLIGGFDHDAFEDYLLDNTDVLVATPEKIDLLLRTQKTFFENVTHIVVDEGHIVGDIEGRRGNLRHATLGRGARLELLIARLRRISSQPSIIFLSAVMPDVNASEFSTWLAKSDRTTKPIKVGSEARPSRLVLTKFEWVSDDNGELEFVGLDDRPNGRPPFAPYFVKRQKFKTGNLTPHTGKEEKRVWPKSKDSKVQTTAMVASKFAESGPVLVFTYQKSHVSSIADNLVEFLSWLEASDQSPSKNLQHSGSEHLSSHRVTEEWLGDDHSLLEWLSYGIGVHHGDLPNPVRNSIEYDYKNGDLDILISTSTLGQGVNLPIKTVIFYNTEIRYRDNEEIKVERLPVRDFFNICGRAGRATKETEGKAVFICQSDRDKDILNHYQNSSYERVQSELYSILLDISKERIEPIDLLRYFDSTLLSLMAEELVDVEDLDNLDRLKSLVGDSLVGIQAENDSIDIDPLVSLMQKNARYVADEVPDSTRRRAFASTGMSVSTCNHIEDAVEKYIRQIDGEIPETLFRSQTYDFELLESVVEASQDVRELEGSRREFHPSGEAEVSIVQNWVEGLPVNALKSKGGEFKNTVQVSKYISSLLNYSLPWFCNAFISVLAFKLNDDPDDQSVSEMRDELPQTWQHLASFVKYGVSTLSACWVCSLGVESRATAQYVADYYSEEVGFNHLKKGGFSSFTEWFSQLTDQEIKTFHSDPFARKKLRQIRNSLTGSRKHRQFINGGGMNLTGSVVAMDEFDQDELVSDISGGEELELERAQGTSDPDAVAVLARGQRIGYMDRRSARILSIELDVGRDVRAKTKRIMTVPGEQFPILEVSVSFESPSVAKI